MKSSVEELSESRIKKLAERAKREGLNAIPLDQENASADNIFAEHAMVA